MRSILLVLTLALATPIAAAPQSPAAEDRLIGAWAGTYDGESMGQYTMSFARDGSGPVKGTLEVMPDGGTGYSVPFKSIVVKEASVTLAYDSPEAQGVEVQLDGTLEGASLAGTWKVTEAGATVSTGTFAGTKK